MKASLPKLAKTLGVVATAATMTCNASAKSDFVLPRDLGDVSPVHGSIGGIDIHFSQVLNEFYNSPEVSSVAKMLVNDNHDYKNPLTKKVENMASGASITKILELKNGRDALTTKETMEGLNNPNTFALCAQKNFSLIPDASGVSPLDSMRENDIEILKAIMKKHDVTLKMVNGATLYATTMGMEL